jgi:UDP:flavonoid glycosyltransferase YjiC (YdhE family)
MRVLFTTHPASGHFHPQVPLARALAAAGHDAAFACSTAFSRTVEAAGFHCVPAGLDWLEAAAIAQRWMTPALSFDSAAQMASLPPAPHSSCWTGPAADSERSSCGQEYR